MAQKRNVKLWTCNLKIFSNSWIISWKWSLSANVYTRLNDIYYRCKHCFEKVVQWELKELLNIVDRSQNHTDLVRASVVEDPKISVVQGS